MVNINCYQLFGCNKLIIILLKNINITVYIKFKMKQNINNYVKWFIYANSFLALFNWTY